MIGAMLGPYRILEKLGEGGMGEVYKARDTRLDRTVAIKVLPAEFAVDPDRRARFEREARAISQLSHPHICSLFDIGEAMPSAFRPTPSAEFPTPVPSSVSFLVMEHLEGETLATRLDRGPLPLAEALRIGSEMASALDSAHRHGIVHRDIKPANIILTKGGTKLMDFGLARPVALTAEAGPVSDSPTIRRPLTGEGTIVGTLQYMAPEQLEGKEADARTDLWALGCVLYEMATGKHAFAGTSQASLIVAIMERQPPPITEAQPLSPPALERIVKRCLAKDPDERFQSARDLGFDLEGVSTASGLTAGGAALPSIVAAGGRGARRLGVWVVGGIALAAALFATGFFLARQLTVSRSPEPALARFAVTVPPGNTIVTDAAADAISPDGSRLVFTVMDQAGMPRLWIRSLDALEAWPLPGTEKAIIPFWSPDSRFVAFFSDGRLRRVSVAGGSPEVICDAPDGRGGTWNKDGVIVFAPQISGPLLRVSANGGEVAEVARPDSDRHETGLRFPSFLPDGKHFLYVAQPSRKGGFEVYVGSLDSKEHSRLMTSDWAPVYAEPGYLLFAAAGGRLVAQRFDESKLSLTGDVLPLGGVAPVSTFDAASALSVSANGVVAFATAGSPDTELVWLDRSGHPLSTIPLPAGRYENPAISPDGRLVAVEKATSPNTEDLWSVDLERPVPKRLTVGSQAPPGGGITSRLMWSIDSTRIAFQDNPSGPYDIYQVAANGTGQPEPLVQSNVFVKSPVAWTPDGKYLIFSQVGDTTGWDLWLLPLTGNRTPVPYIRTPFNEITAAVSPDGRWVAYDSDETGTAEIYVQSFPVPGEKHPVTSAGGICAQWSSTGRELIVWSGSQNFYGVGPVLSVDVQTTPTFKAGTPRVLFTPRQDLAGLPATSDLKRFLTAVPVEGAPPASITVMLNWQAALKGR